MYRDHIITVPWDRRDPSLGTLDIFAREISLDDSLPYLLYLQGGPGFPSPRPLEIDGWLKAALRHYRVILLDQRGTGRSGRIDRFSLLDARYLRLLGAPHIVDDAEDLRRALGVEQWDVLGQSFGGFCITSYLSRYPDAIAHAYFTGGLPATGCGIDDVYRATYTALKARHEAFLREFPWAGEQIRRVCERLDTGVEKLPTGEVLSSRRFRTIGIELGRQTGFAALAALLEEPFHAGGHLRGDFLAELSARLSFESAPLYAVIHESIYGGLTPGATAWSAHRIREEFPEFAEGGTYLTGEHIYPWQFEEDPALRPFAAAAEELAAYEGWQQPYDPAVLGTSRAVCAAAVYSDDIFVPREQSLATAGHFADMRIWESAEHQHDGLRRDGEAIFTRLFELARVKGES